MEELDEMVQTVLKKHERKKRRGKYYEKNQEKILERHTQYRRGNREKHNEYNQRYRKGHPKEVKEYHRRYRENHREKISDSQKRYFEANKEKFARIKRNIERQREKMREYHRRYHEKNQEVRLIRQKEYRERCKKADENREFMIVYREKRAKTFAETVQEQLNEFKRRQKQTQEKLKALGPKRLSVVLTDCLKSPSRDPRPSADMRTPVVMYLESFCQSLDAEEHEEEEDLSFLDTLNQADINEPQSDILSLDSGQIETVNQYVWDRDLSEWLDDLIEVLDEQSKLESFENNFDFIDFVGDMTPDDWEN